LRHEQKVSNRGLLRKYAAVSASADRQAGDDFAVIGIENHHRLWFLAGGEEDVIFCVKCYE
jgi:hypothetical protein